ncbi:MAG: ATP-binding cassette domain-containing protein [Bdellovibrionales bacterium]|nr:ATP-binding cassette domain-containing protein [Bdellovibrionales bacterium]
MVIEFKNVDVTFDEKVVLRNVSFQIRKGEKFVLVGPSGQGKSIVLKLIAGLLEPTAGEVIVNGLNINRISNEEKNQLVLKMGMLFQKNALFDSLTVGENIAFPLREIKKISEKEIQKKVNYFLHEVAIPHAKNLYPDEISGGMQKRLGIARALALEPEIVLYDDPTAGLDPITSRRIINLINWLQFEQNSTVVAITNEMNRAYQLGHTIALVAEEEILVTGDEDDTKKNKDERVIQFINGKLFGPLTEIQ